MKLPSKSFLVVTQFIAIVVLLNAVIFGGIWFYTNYTIVAVPRDKEVVLVDPENKEIVKNCNENIVPCDYVFDSKEEITLD